MKNKGIKTLLGIFMITLLINISNIYALSITAPSKVALGNKITLTVNFGTNIGAYDSINVDYNPNVLAYVSGDKTTEGVWWDTTDASNGITSKTYTFLALNNASTTITFTAKGLTSANANMDYIGDQTISKTIIVGSGVLKGDVDNNGSIDANDASIILELYKSGQATAEQIKYADMDSNGILDANDASLILELYKVNK